MDSDGALVIDLRRPGWSGSAEAYLAGFASDPPKEVRFELDDTSSASAEEAQLVCALVKFASAVDSRITVEGAADGLIAAMAKIGLTDVFPAEGASAP